jgi:serine/threonine-protein kinase
MADIFLARSEGGMATSRVVVKTILPELAVRQDFVDMFVREAKLASRLSHANVVTTWELGKDDGGAPYMVLDYVEGFDLNELLRRASRKGERVPREFLLHVAMEVLGALDYAHRAKDAEGRPLGIVHRDVSPSNVLVSFEGEVKVCDFGIARANDLADAAAKEVLGDGPAPEDHPLTAVRENIKGKIGYMSPEQARGEVVDARSDVFAAGVVLWELVQGRRMMKGSDSVEERLEKARECRVPELETRGFPAEDELFRIVRKALSKEPDDRYATAGAMQADLRAYVVGNRLGASSLALGTWMRETFGEDMVLRRRAREVGAMALRKGPPVVLRVIEGGARAAEPAQQELVAEASPAPSEVTGTELTATGRDEPTVPSVERAVEAAPPIPFVVPGADAKKPVWLYALVPIALALAGLAAMALAHR